MPTDSGREPDLRFEFGHDVQAPRQARRQLDALLPDDDDVIADDVRVATGELISNVVLHTEDGGEFRAWDPRPDVPVRIEVEDSNTELPHPALEPTPDRGRGLRIVEAVSDRWGVDRQAAGKVVWAEFDREERRATADGNRSTPPADPDPPLPD